MMLCGVAVRMLLEGAGGLQARLASHAPLLVEPGFSPQGVCFQPEGAHMLKVAHSSTAPSLCTFTAQLLLTCCCSVTAYSHPCLLNAHTLLACCVLAVLLSDSLSKSLTRSLNQSLNHSLTHSLHNWHSIQQCDAFSEKLHNLFRYMPHLSIRHPLASALSTLVVHTCAVCPCTNACILGDLLIGA